MWIYLARRIVQFSELEAWIRAIPNSGPWCGDISLSRLERGVSCHTAAARSPLSHEAITLANSFLAVISYPPAPLNVPSQPCLETGSAFKRCGHRAAICRRALSYCQDRHPAVGSP